MTPYFLRTAFRNLWKYKSFTAINIMGLCIGLTACLLIGLFIYDELQFDRHHPEAERLYRVISYGGERQSDSWAGGSPALSPTMEADFPEVEQGLRLYQVRQKLLFQKDGDSYLEENGYFAEPAIFEFFDLPLRYGDPATALSQPQEVVLSPALAAKYFGDSDPVGQSIQINNKELKVTGVLAGPNPHFHLSFDYLLPFEYLLNEVSGDRINSWVWQDFLNYVKLHPGVSEAELNDKLRALAEEKIHPETEKLGFSYYPLLQPVKDIHLHSAHISDDPAVRGNRRYVNGLALVGLFLVLIACINFINLTTARAVRRAKEVGIRKTAGARRSQLAAQFIGEAILMVAIAMVLAVQLVRLLLPSLNDFTGKAMAFPVFGSPLLLLALTGLTLVTGVLAGAYPAFVLSGFRPALAIQGVSPGAGGHVLWLRKALVVVQFTLSILLITSVIIIFRQIDFLHRTDLGFAKEQLLHFPMKGTMARDLEHTKSFFEQAPGVVSASACFGIPGDIIAGDNVIVPGADRRTVPARIFVTDHDYISTMGMEIVAGRDFSQAIQTDATSAFIINETAVRALGLGDTPQEAIDKPLEWQMWTPEDSLKRGRVIGVVRDFHFQSLHEEVQTSVIHISPQNSWKIALRIDTDDLPATLAAIEAKWDSFESGYPIDYQFVDEGFGAMYTAERKLSRLLWIFTMVAIFIAGIGAFGLAAYATEQRRKEIGIRKILGAGTAGLVGLLSKDFIRLVGLSMLIAFPPAWYLMQQWLSDFAYRIEIQWWFFALSGLLALLIAFVTVSTQGLRAALENPVRSLRSE